MSHNQVRAERLRDGPSICERYGKIVDAAAAKGAFAVVAFNAQALDVKINRNVTKIKSEDHETRRCRAAIVCDRDFLQSLAAVGEVNAGQCAPILYPEADFRAGPIEKR